MKIKRFSKLKTILGFVLLCVMLSQLMPVATAQNEYSGRNIEIAASIAGMNVSGQETVTRAEFARLLVMAMTGEVKTDGATYFQDVLKGDYAFGSISHLASMGIIKGDGVNFYPSKAITRSEAIKMAVMALGYQQPADEKGGYFGGYLMMAGQLQLLGGLSSGETFSGKDAMTLLYHTMHAEMLEITSISDDGFVSEVSQADFLAFYRRIYHFTGTVNATAYTGIGDYQATGRNALVIGDITVENVLPKYHTYIGRKVKVYYSISDDDRLQSVYIGSNEQNYEIYRAEAISDSLSAHTLTKIALNETDKYIKISPYADFIWNGRIHKSITPAELAFSDGYVELIDNGGENGADLVIINSIDYVRVSAVDENNDTIYGGVNQKYELNDAEYLILTDENGKELSLTEIAADDLLEVQISKDISNPILQITRIRNSFSGKISAVETDDNKYLVLEIDDKKYETTRAFNASSQAADVAVGKYGIYYLNSDGKIAAVKFTEESDMLYGYLLEAENSHGFATDGKLKIYTQENKCQIYEMTDKVAVNYSTSKQKETDVVNALMENGRAKQQMLRFGLNKDGQINKLFIATELNEYDGVTEFYHSKIADYAYSNGSKILYLLEEKATAFYVGTAVAYFNVLPISEKNPSRLTEDDIYVSYAPHLTENANSNYTVESIVYDFGYTKNAQCVFNYPKKSRTIVYDNNLILINEVRTALDEEGEEIPRFHGYKKSQRIIYEPSDYMKLYSPDKVAAVKPGDVYIATFDRVTFGQMEDVQKVYSAGTPWVTGELTNHTSTSLTYGKQSIIKGIAYDRDSEVLCLDLGGGDKQVFTTNYITNYYYYNASKGIYIPSAGYEIRTERETGAGSKVIVYSRYGVAYDIIILD